MAPAARLIVLFAAAGHFAHHVLTGIFLTLAIVLERVWEKPYAEVITLWTLGAMLIGLGAPAAGWLADRFGHARMMAVFYLGIGASSVAAGLVASPSGMATALAAIGLFGALYHPVGMAWVSMAAPVELRGRVMGWLGIAGSFGVALAAAITGGLVVLAGWRAALIVPGVLTVAGGVMLVTAILAGRVATTAPARTAQAMGAEPDSRAPLGVLVVLAVTFTLGSIVYQAFQTALPKWLSDTLALDAGEAAQLGLVVGATLLLGSVGQLVGGRLADRLPFKWLYVATFVLKLVPLALAGLVGGPGAVLAAAVIGFTFDMSAPVENLLLARYSSGRRRGLAFGMKFAMGFAAAPIGVNLVAWTYADGASGAPILFAILAVLTAAMLAAALLLPREQAARPRGLAPAE
ncbi:MFS transporter [Roseomonas sp. PWR1]|uniref:MFS transporter n=1 Tax=Roseomonas nitratireducens TaxID=2820810 RepID=A0ABS4AT30_9PROT|nr:MFS transporter [Neoroseomonas nitratireducens]MBP0464399.1 MFS transporter [Neoroseomonas nitratireducens]